MSIQLTTSQILQIARLCQPMTVVTTHTDMILKGGDLNVRQALLIYMERKAVENRYNLNPSDPTLQQTSNYLFSLLRNWPAAQARINQITGGLPIISNPSNVSVVAGNNATFSVTVTSASAYTVQWYRNGVAIPGATGLSYTLVNAQLSDSGAVFNAIATNASGGVASLDATLTVTTALQALWWWGPTDPYPALSGGSDTLSYQITQALTHNAPVTINYASQSGAENNQFNVLKVPNTENSYVAWKNTDSNQGTIPDSVMRPILNINGFKYVITLNAMSLDSLTTTLTYS